VQQRRQARLQQRQQQPNADSPAGRVVARRILQQETAGQQQETAGPQQRQTAMTDNEMCRLAHVMSDPEIALITSRIYDNETRTTLDSNLSPAWDEIANAFNDGENLYRHPNDGKQVDDDPERDIANIEPNPAIADPLRTGTYLCEKWRNMKQWFTRPYSNWAASGQMDGGVPIQDFIQFSGANKTPHPHVVIYMFELFKDDENMLDVASRRLSQEIAVETGGANDGRVRAQLPQARAVRRRTTGNITGDDLVTAFAEGDAAHREADAAMLQARAVERNVRNQAIFNLLSQRVILPPDLQQQLDNGMRAFMANLFG